MMFRQLRPALRRLLTGTIALLLLAVISIVVTTVVAQRRLLPQVVAWAEQRAGAACECQVQIAHARYRPFRRIDLHRVSARDPLSGTAVSVRRIRVRMPLRGAVGFLRRRSDIAALADAGGEPWWEAVGALAAERMIPLRVNLQGFELTFSPELGLEPLIIPAAEMRHARDQGRVTFEVTENSGTVARLSAHADYRAGVIASTAELLPLPVDGLHPAIDSGTVSFNGTATRERDGRVHATAFVAARALAFDIPVVSDERVRIREIDYDMDLVFEPTIPVGPRYQNDPPFPSLDFAHGVVSVTRGELRVGELVAELRPSLRGVTGGSVPSATDAAPLSNRSTAARAQSPAGRLLTAVPRYLVLDLSVPQTPAAALLDTVPSALLGPLEAAEVTGSFWWDATVRVPMHSISWMDLTADGGVSDLAVTAMPASMNVHSILGRFDHTIVDPVIGYAERVSIPEMQLPPLPWLLQHSERTERYLRRVRREQEENRTAPPLLVRSDDPATPQAALTGSPLPFEYHRLTEISDWVISAVLTAEDGDFFFHDGISSLTLPRAIERNLLAGEVQFGASTISMQLAKMLFLDQARLFSRKLQEVLLVYIMEQVVPVPKSRILELYLNLAEFGPGIFGVGRAARYYFDKLPGELDVGEATWLASILPSPKRYHAYFEAGEITPGWFARMQAIYAVMLERERMTQEEYDGAMQGPPQFADRRPDAFELPDSD